MFSMFAEKLKDPFQKMLARMFSGAIAGLIGGLILGVFLGLLLALLDVVGGDVFRASQAIYFAAPGMMFGALLGAIFGGLFGTFRKD